MYVKGECEGILGKLGWYGVFGGECVCNEVGFACGVMCPGFVEGLSREGIEGCGAKLWRSVWLGFHHFLEFLGSDLIWWRRSCLYVNGS